MKVDQIFQTIPSTDPQTLANARECCRAHSFTGASGRHMKCTLAANPNTKKLYYIYCRIGQALSGLYLAHALAERFWNIFVFFPKLMKMHQKAYFFGIFHKIKN